MNSLIKKLLRESLKPKKIYAGCLIYCTTTDKFFLLHRNDPNPTWSLVSGGINEGETPLEGLKREIVEELSINPEIVKYEFVDTEITPNNKDGLFYYFKGYTTNEFKAKLDHENLSYGWFSMDELPESLYPRFIDKLKSF